MVDAYSRFEESDRINERWERCPVIWRRDDGTSPVGELKPAPSKPPFGSATHGLLTAVRYTLRDGEYMRVGTTRSRYPRRTVEIWYPDKGEARHVYGFGTTVREAYEDALRIRRQVKRFGSISAAVQFGRNRATVAYTGLHEDFEDDLADVAKAAAFADMAAEGF